MGGRWQRATLKRFAWKVDVGAEFAVPPSVIDRMRRANEKSKEHAVAEGIAIAREI